MKAPSFPWLPVGFAVSEKTAIRRVLATGPRKESIAYQICSTNSDDVCLLLKNNSIPPEEIKAMESTMKIPFAGTEFGGENFVFSVFPNDNAPMRIADIPARDDFHSATQLRDLAEELAKIKTRSWGESLYFPTVRHVLPFGKPESGAKKRQLATRLLTGGVGDTTLSPKQIHAINPWVTNFDINRFYHALDMGEDKKPDMKKPRPADEFFLPGQPELEKFFKEVIDYYHNQSKYEKMGVRPVRGILLHGVPGAGKTYSVNKLADFLEWEMVEIGSSDVGSKYIHETSGRIRRKFDEARAKAPAIVFLDEIDALGMSRESSGHDHKIEEVNELLRQVEKAGQDGLLVIAATNYLGALDDALMRKGRFDLIIRVNLPEKDAVLAALEHCLSTKPCAAGLHLETIAEKLSERPLSDVDWVVNKAGYIAVKSSKEKIDQECLEQAAQYMPNANKERYIL